MNSGIYGLFDLAGGDANPADLAALDLLSDGEGFALRVSGEQSPEASISRERHRCTVLLGHIGEIGRIANELGATSEVRPVGLARLALDQWQGTAATKLPGEWLILDWRPDGVVLVQSAARWVRTFYARQGTRIAIGGDVFGLSRLSWIGRDLDEAGFMFSLGRTALRARAMGRTILPGVGELQPGETVRFTQTETLRSAELPFAQAKQWSGSFEEAMEETRDLLDRIVDERLSRHDNVACLLSGGLDSSLLTLIVKERLRSGQRAVCLTSAAPPKSGLFDELEYARIVAEELDLEIVPVIPGPFPGIFAPDPSAFHEANGPSLSVRHYLYAALNQQAHSLGVTCVFDGAYGEMTVTGFAPPSSIGWRLRQLAKQLLGRGDRTDPSPFHARLAPHRLSALPDTIAAAPDGSPARRPRRRGENWGYFEGIEKTWLAPANAVEELTSAYPFRDPRLLQLFAGFPAEYLAHHGMTRAPARAMMRGRLPDSIRLRQKGLPFSPDYALRLQAEAPAARARIPAFRKADVDDWLDLDWLDKALAALAGNGPQGVINAFEVQVTAMVAEFLTWWRTGGG